MTRSRDLADRGYQALTPESTGIVSVKDFGAVGDGVTDDTAAFESANEEIFPTSGRFLHIPFGEYKANYTTNKAQIDGNGATIVAQTTDPTLKLGVHSPNFRWYDVNDLILGGNGGTSIAMQYDPSTQYSGRFAFKSVSFQDASIGVDKTRGNIGNIYKECFFARCDIGLRAYNNRDGGDVMHSGTEVIQHCRFEQIDTAAIYIDDELGAPGWSIRDCIIEGNAGFGIYIDAHDANAHVPINIDNVWMETTATTTTAIPIEGSNRIPREIFLNGVHNATISNSGIANIELRNSILNAKNCKIDNTLTLNSPQFIIDASSALVCEDLIANGTVGPGPWVRSLARQNNVASANYSVRGPLKVAYQRRNGISNGINISSNSYSGSGPWTFSGTTTVTATSVADGVISESCAQLTVPSGNEVVGDTSGSLVPGKWYVWSIHAKLISADTFPSARIGYTFALGDIYLSRNKWVCSYGMQKANTTGDISLFLRNGTGATGDVTVRLADYFVYQFDSFEEAHDYCNNGLVAKNEI